MIVCDIGVVSVIRSCNGDLSSLVVYFYRRFPQYQYRSANAREVRAFSAVLCCAVRVVTWRRDDVRWYCSAVMIVRSRSSVSSAVDRSSSSKRRASVRVAEPLLSASLSSTLPRRLRTAATRGQSQVCLSVGRNVDYRRTVA